MAQHFKYNTGSTLTNTTQKGNLAVATNGTLDWGPTSTTGYYPETTPPTGGYTIYYMRPTGGPSVVVANNDSQAIFFLKSFGSTGSTISDVLSWASGQANYYVQTGATVSVVTSGLMSNLDASNILSYPGTGTTWTDLSGNGNNGTLANSPTYDSANGGSLLLNGTNQRILINCAANSIRAYNSTTHFVVKLPLYSGGQRCILSYRDTSVWASGTLYIGKSSGGFFTYYDNLNLRSYTAGSVTDNTIVMVDILTDATNGSITYYINGSLVGSATGRSGFYVSYNSTMYLGYDNGGTAEYMAGNFYHFMHYNRILTPTEITQNYNATKTRFGL